LAHQIKRKPYKTGERPKKNDLVWRWWVSNAGERGKDYGIVVGFKINRRQSWEYPVVYWKNKNRTHMTLTTTIRLMARAK
jgi:hypothetical protein